MICLATTIAAIALGAFSPDGHGRLNWSDWINERTGRFGSSGVWFGETQKIEAGVVRFRDDDESPDARFIPTETEPTNAITEVTAFICFEHPFAEDVPLEGVQAAVRMVCAPDGRGGAENRLACVVDGGWTNVSVAGVTLEFDVTYGIRTRIDRTSLPAVVTYSILVGEQWRELCSGNAGEGRRTSRVRFRGEGTLSELAADSNIDVPEGVTAHAGTRLFATMDEAFSADLGKVTALTDASYSPKASETMGVASGVLTLTRPLPACEPALIADGCTLHLDATQGIESFTNAAGEVCVTRWNSLAGNGWAAVPGPSYRGWVRYPRLLPNDCNGHPAIRLAHGTLDAGDEYMLMQKDAVTARFGNVRSVFWVVGSQDGGGFLLGGGSHGGSGTTKAGYPVVSGYTWHRGGGEPVCSVASNPLASRSGDHAMFTGNWRLNGESVDALTTGLSGYYDMVSMSILNKYVGDPLDFDGLAFDGRILGASRNYVDTHGRIGFQRLGEVIVYDRILSDDERNRIEAYLCRKWCFSDDTWRHPLTVDVRAGATLDVSADSARRLAALSGSGFVRGDVTVDQIAVRVGETPISVSGRLVLASNFVVRVDGLVDDGRNSYSIPVASAASVSGLPCEVDVLRAGVPTDMKARLSFDGGLLWLVLWRKDGTIFTIGEYSSHVNYRADAVDDAAVRAARASRPYDYAAEPMPERPERMAAAEEDVLVYAADNLTASYPIMPDSTNVPGPAGVPLRLRDCPGERTRGTVLLWSKTAWSGVSVSFSDLTGSVGTIPAGYLSAKVVKTWYQATGAPYRHTMTSYEQVPVPELMLNDDKLVIADHANRRNLVRFQRGSRTWYADLTTFRFDSWAELIPAEEVPIYDAPTLQPFDIRARVSKQLMLRLAVPSGAVAGDYAGTVSFVSGGETIAVLPVELTVLPFALPKHPETFYDRTREYTMGLYLWNSFNNADRDYIAVYNRSRRQLQNEYASLIENGITEPTFIWYKDDVYDDANFRRNLEEVRKAGFAGKHLHLGSSDLVGTDFSAQALLTLTNNIVRALATAREYGYDDIYFYGVDEKTDPVVLTNEVRVWQAVHAVGGKIMVSTTEANRPHFQNALDLAVHSQPYDEIDAVDVEAWHDGGTLLWKYGSPQTYYENPLLYRRNFGLGIWLRGFDGANTYCDVGASWAWYDAGMIRLYAETAGKKGNEGRALTLYYPVPDGVIETLALTGLESAIKDVRYFSLLRQLLRERPDAEIQTWIDALDIDAADPAEVRRKTIDAILRLLDI